LKAVAVAKSRKKPKPEKNIGGATITVEWGYDLHSITLTERNWRRVKAGKPLSIRGKGYHYEGEFFWDYWQFSTTSKGSLLVGYGEDCGVGFDGELKDADIEEIKPENVEVPADVA